MQKKTPTKEEILAYFDEIPSKRVHDFIDIVIFNPNFQICSGSGSADKHHYGDGGLLRHTYEVVCHARAIAATHLALTGEQLKIDELIVAIIWHDFGKIWDYQRVNGVWGKHDNHAREIHHVSRSAIEFQKFAATIEIPHGFDIDHVTHMILAHHGRREWGSPVSPHTQEAWVVHMADNLSARLCDHKTHPVG